MLCLNTSGMRGRSRTLLREVDPLTALKLQNCKNFERQTSFVPTIGQKNGEETFAVVRNKFPHVNAEGAVPKGDKTNSFRTPVPRPPGWVRLFGVGPAEN